MDWGWKGFFKRLFEFPDADGDSAAAPIGRARLRYEKAADQLQVSRNEKSYLAVAMGGAGVAAVGTVAELSALDDTTMLDGAAAEVNSVLDQFLLSKTSTATVDGITIASTASGTGRWLRRGLGNQVWAAQTTWHVDNVNGNDENIGDTAATALASWDEIRRRLAGQTTTGFVYAYLHGGPYPALICDWKTVGSVGTVVDSAWIVTGDLTEVAQEVIVARTAYSNATPVYGNIQFGVDVSAYIGLKMTAVDGVAANATSWAQASGGGVDFVRTKPFLTTVNLEAFPDPGDTISFGQPVQVDSIQTFDGCITAWANVHCLNGASFEEAADNSFNPHGCRFDGRVYVLHVAPNQGSIAGDQKASLGVQFGDSYFTGWLIVDRGGLALIQCCAFTGTNGLGLDAGLYVKSAGQLGTSLSSGFVGDGAGNDPVLEVQGLARMVGGSYLAFENYAAASDCIRVYDNGRFVSTSVWGTDIAAGAGWAISVGAGSLFTYAAATPPNFAPRTDLQVGGTAKTTATIPYPEPTNFAGIVVEV